MVYDNEQHLKARTPRACPWVSQIFDGEIESEIIKRFCEVEKSNCNSYYKYLCEVSKKEDEEKKD